MEPNFFLCPVILLLKPDQGFVVFYHRAHPRGMGHEVLLACTLITRDEHPVGQRGWGSFVKWCRILFYGAMAYMQRHVYGHACLPELCFFSVLRVEVPAFVCPLQLAGCGAGLGHLCPGDLELCTCQYWGVVPATASASSRTLAITTALPQALFILPLPACASTTVCTLNGSRKLTGMGLVSVSHAA